MKRSTFVALAFVALSRSFVAQPMTAETFVTLPGTAATGKTPSEALGFAEVGERHCNAARCVVIASLPDHLKQLDSLRAAGLIMVMALEDAGTLRFTNASYDVAKGAFDADFPGKAEYPAGGTGLVAVAFKSFPEPQWLKLIEAEGYVALEPIYRLGYLFYGPRSGIEGLRKKTYVRGAVELPAGLKRHGIDVLAPGDSTTDSAETSLVVVDLPGSATTAAISRYGALEGPTYRLGKLIGYTIRLTPESAKEISRFSDVVVMTRETSVAGPSDERVNRIIRGDPSASVEGVPGTAWLGPGWPLASLPQNTPGTYGYYWDTFLHYLNGVSGFNLGNQAIGFCDTGVSVPTYESDFAPDVNFRTDFGTPDFDSSATRARDVLNHGTASTAIAAGRTTPTSLRDATTAQSGYSFQQGVAPGTKICVSKIFGLGNAYPGYCGDESLARTVGAGQLNTIPLRIQYSLIELGSTGVLPDADRPQDCVDNGWVWQNPLGAAIINHSWNDGGNSNYNNVSVLLDQTARDAKLATIDYFAKTADVSAFLHVVSAGNYTGVYPATTTTIYAPGLSKNVLTVGASFTYNQETYTPVEPGLGPPCVLPFYYGVTNGLMVPASNGVGRTHVIAPFSCVGFPAHSSRT